ncbi:MAG: PhoPQ-activated pathogenicity-like protein PqaA type [Verrucomicrobia bacterium]|nr:PhoPQ-activated pathogenicity-like protein PqaA type [Verrucomicrobiota bacterium]
MTRVPPPRVPRTWLGAASLPLLILAAPPAHAGALEDYVRTPDDAFQWTIRSRSEDAGFARVHLDVTSQRWRSHPWQHHVQIVYPTQLRHPDAAFLFITGDGDGKSALGLLNTVAERAGAAAAVVTQVPNQPLCNGRREDALIAFTFDQYTKTGDATWPLLFPMVKSAVRAMDAVAGFAHRERGHRIGRFVVSGASKRGWTTWLTGAADPRVAGIAPMVIDMLNMKAQTQWADRVYGRQSERIRDYTDLGLVARLDDPPMKRLRDWVDPYSYRQRYTMPKLILLGTNDPYWTVDSLRHYWHDLPGPKLLFQAPNGGHGFNAPKGLPPNDGSHQATQTLAAFVQMLADGHPLPTVDWQFTHNSHPEITVVTRPPAHRIQLWSATSADRDFRNDPWHPHPQVKTLTSHARFDLPPPERGYRAGLAEVLLTSPTGHPYRLSTAVRVVPDPPR